MVIGNSQLNMESSRFFKTTASKINNVVTSTSAAITKISTGYESVYSESKTTANKDAGDSFSASLESKTKSENTSEADEATLGGSGFNLGRRRIFRIYDPADGAERMSAKRIREQTLIYLILRLRRMLTGEEKPDSMDKLSGYSNVSTVSNAVSSPNTYNASNNIIGYNITRGEYSETETTEFATTGKVITKDGREIDFNVELTMSRSLSKAIDSVRQITGSVSNLIDPLVINLDSNPVEVSDQKFLFDLDSDGKEESISMLGGGSGFLALDRNGDGVINDGSELFGTKSGNGFGDLAEYDEDGNGWIDEADEIFDKLIIWTKDQDGNDKMYKLKDLDVGALCLENVKTDFSVKNSDNTNGIIRHTGFFLYEDGRAGTMQHLDMAT